MQDEFKEHVLNLTQVIILFALLVMPQIVGTQIITDLDVTEVMQYFNIFATIAGTVIIYYLIMAVFHGRLINRIDEMVYLKYLVVIIILFWAVADGYLAYIYQKAYLLNDAKIGPRNIVWRDVPFEDLPADVIYPNFRVAFLFVLSGARGVVLAVLAYGLITDKSVRVIRRKLPKRQKLKEKTIEELKANVHPSVLKGYKNKNSD